ncbi:ABC transporter ATP-binding protein [Haladaptatus sp. NG-SE-30]
MHAIELTDVTKSYGDVMALDGLSLSVETGTTFGLLGTNGAGKTTLFKLLVGHLRPDSGSVTVAGTDASDARVRKRVGYVPERAGFPPALTGREVLSFHARMRNLGKTKRIDHVLDIVGLTDAADRAVDGYSNGMCRRLALGTALLARPQVLLLDEPTAGLDPRGVDALHAVVHRLGEEDDLTVVLSSHVLDEVEQLCDDAAILHGGRVLTAGSIADLRRESGESVTVSARLADASEVETATTVVRRHGKLVKSGGSSVTAACSPSDVRELLDDLDDAVALDGVEVAEPGLGKTFRSVLDSNQRYAEVQS